MTQPSDVVEVSRIAADWVRTLDQSLGIDREPERALRASEIRDLIGAVVALAEELPQIFERVGVSAFDAYGGERSGLDELAAATRTTIWLVRAGDDADRLRHDLSQAFLAADQLTKVSRRPVLRPIQGGLPS
jgi:hypothetical protein